MGISTDKNHQKLKLNYFQCLTKNLHDNILFIKNEEYSSSRTPGQTFSQEYVLNLVSSKETLTLPLYSLNYSRSVVEVFTGRLENSSESYKQS